ncbi:DoxX family protein [Corynebacterium pseudodiphtheriticum]|uniref:DoxX family protein n=1 Tax=Corynebacterium pseudodiphtheriticum TaxID=37637 RepID=UPI00254EC5D4|nr:DoxX family protein [Corynebacterium pseudodiphtheriticum]MDK8500471.1 DoxX family protein [Corynebacterium pseudodiphtheriticum]MDK8583926.1 DoxX family protein [Corynebacterium pseudodiphtheriticum]MDK8614739.1 DoxX family protein [Corynebacterium pseudodiphtheriticum]MDK8738678.1 DoxX family protein [Corynebacterium pseudodiphtheriticum]MDK8745220.1 DoxX family protein [Corynebacterium pseudodiphtheriticum]
MTVIRDIFLLIARIILGGVLIAHGWQKFNEWTIDGTASSFQEMGVPSPEISAQVATWFEIGGGAAIILGLLVRLVGPVLFVQMAGAAWFAHRDSGIFVSDGGWEFVAVIGAAGLALSAAGAGRASLDHLFVAPFRKRKEEKEAAPNQQAVGAGAGVAGSGIAGAEQNFGGENFSSQNSAQNYGQSSGQEYSDDQDFSTPNFDNAAGNNSTADGVDANAETTQWSTDNQWDNGKK